MAQDGRDRWGDSVAHLIRSRRCGIDQADLEVRRELRQRYNRRAPCWASSGDNHIEVHHILDHLSMPACGCHRVMCPAECVRCTTLIIADRVEGTYDADRIDSARATAGMR